MHHTDRTEMSDMCHLQVINVIMQDEGEQRTVSAAYLQTLRDRLRTAVQRHEHPAQVRPVQQFRQRQLQDIPVAELRRVRMQYTLQMQKYAICTTFSD